MSIIYVIAIIYVIKSIITLAMCMTPALVETVPYHATLVYTNPFLQVWYDFFLDAKQLYKSISSLSSYVRPFL